MSLKKLWLLCALLPMLFAGQVSCSEYYGSCCPQMCCDPCSGWEIYGEWLYWRARRCDLDYAVPFNNATPQTSIGDVSEVAPCYDSGFRVGVSKECGDFFFDVFYTYYRTDETDTTTSATGTLAGTRIVDTFTDLTQGALEFARGKWDLDYDTVDVLAGYSLCNRNCFESYFFGGFKYARVDQKLKVLYSALLNQSTDIDRSEEEIDMNAYGIDLGFGAKYNFCGCFNFFGRFSYDVLLGDFERKFIYQTSTDGGATVLERGNLRDDCWRMLGVFNFAFGLGYDYQFCDCCISNLGLSIGYEFHQWTGMPDFLDFQAESNEITFDRHLQSLGFDGLFVRVSVGF